MGFGALQQIVQRLQLLTVRGALRDAEMERGEQENLALGVEDVDLAFQLLRRIEQHGGGGDVAVEQASRLTEKLVEPHW